MRRLACFDRVDHRALDRLRFAVVAEVLEHHRGGEDRADRIGDVFPRVLRRAAVNRLEERHASGMNVARRRHP